MYFQAYIVVVLTQLPLRSILRSADYTRRIAKWGTILGAFDIRYMPRNAVKGQVLADLVAEFVEPSPKEGGGDTKHGQKVGQYSLSARAHLLESIC